MTTIAQRESMEYDLLIVGGGSAGLVAAIRAKQAAQAAGADISVAVVEKGASLGAHTLSGALLDPHSLDELLPDWREHTSSFGAPLTDESLWLLSEKRAFRLPNWSLPKSIRHPQNILISPGRLVVWLGEQAEACGVDIFTGFAATQPLYADDSPESPLIGVVTGDFGVDRQGNHKPNYQPGVELRARYTLLAEGCRGSLTRVLEEHFHLRSEVVPQKYGLGFRELWRIPAKQHQAGKAIHFMGWPLADRAGGGGFVYHLPDQHVAVGLVVHLDYENPSLSPFDEFQRLKTHPMLKVLLHGGERVGFGARTLTGGGWQSFPIMPFRDSRGCRGMPRWQILPNLAFSGGALIGEAAGMVNLSRMQGIHTSMKSAMLAAEAAVSAITQQRAHDTLHDYPAALRTSWVRNELYAARNIKPYLRFGFARGLLCAGFFLWAQQLKLGWLSGTLQHKSADHLTLRPAAEMPTLVYPPYDCVTTFDRASSVYLAHTQHEEDQPCHLRLIHAELPERLNLPRYGGPERLYCPAGVYEYRPSDDTPDAPLSLRICAANCLHCKACDIKDPSLNILWTPPEGGSGPHYVM
ncbi:MAG: electron transfer flavoprotein-ubiquinone oxidoreductase [Burkholderiales bacterium]|jgi:electron-transferring-flavoprotein dehydrogenase|nr:electron transfer flavoprotein-ubiquinone oxidoreductase [Burkholderiales bacterium]